MMMQVIMVVTVAQQLKMTKLVTKSTYFLRATSYTATTTSNCNFWFQAGVFLCEKIISVFFLSNLSHLFCREIDGVSRRLTSYLLGIWAYLVLFFSPNGWISNHVVGNPTTTQYSGQHPPSTYSSITISKMSITSPTTSTITIIIIATNSDPSSYFQTTAKNWLYFLVLGGGFSL